jgi:hypothetical protein
MTEVKITPGGEGEGYTATVNGTPIQIAAYIADPGDHGKVMVSLIVAADALQVGIPPTRRDLEQTRQLNKPPVSTWGDKTRPDPRASIPGWQPPAAAVDAHRGRQGGEHRLENGWPAAAIRKLLSGWRLA